MTDISWEQAVNCNLILQLLCDNSPYTTSVDNIHKYLFSSRPKVYSLSLFLILERYNPSLLAGSDETQEKNFRPTNYASVFLHEGGFIKKYEQDLAKQNAEIAKEKLNLEKLKYDVKNSKRVFKTYWITFSFALISFIYVLIQLILLLIKSKS